MAIPIEIIGVGKSEIRVIWDEGDESTFQAQDLRQRCRCANCIEEMTGRQLLDPGSVKADITADTIELVGGYGLRIGFSDGHNTGIYKFKDLYDRSH